MADAEKILSQHEVDALLSAIDSGTGETGSDPSAEAYDFRRPFRIKPEQHRYLQALHETYARTLQAALSGLLLRGVEVRLSGLHELPLRDLLDTLSSPAVTYLVSAEPLEGNFLLSLNPAIGHPLIERLLGASKIGAPQRDRPLSALEWNVADTLAAKLLEVLREAWAPVTPVQFRTLKREANPQAIQFENTNEPTVSAVLEIALGDQRGTMDLAFPVSAIEVHLAKMTSATPFSAKKKDGAPGQEAAITRRLGPAEVELEAHLPGGTIALKELEALRPGDLLVTGHPQGAPVSVTVEGREKFLGRLGCLRDHKAVRITGTAGREAPAPAAPPMSAVSVVKGPGAGPAAAAPPPPGYVENLLQLPLTASVVLAEKPMRLREVLSFKGGEVVTFPQRVDGPLELRAARRAIAHGTCVKVGEGFGLRITSIREPRERVRALGPG